MRGKKKEMGGEEGCSWGKEPGRSEGDVHPPSPHQGGSGSPHPFPSSDPSPDKGPGLPVLCRQEARLSKAAMHPGGQERALQPQATAAEYSWWSLRSRQQGAESLGGEASRLIRLAGYQHLSNAARSPHTSLWTRDWQRSGLGLPLH